MDENLLQKIENQQKLINELTSENEQLFQQFNHLMVRNGKLLKRIDDMQQIIDSMHLRVEESQLINDNLLKLNDNLRVNHDTISPGNDKIETNDKLRSMIDGIHRRIDELHLRNDVLQQRTSMLTSAGTDGSNTRPEAPSPSGIDSERLFDEWKNYPGQHAKNAPNLRKQSQMLMHLFENKSLNAATLFQKTGVNGVTGARYVSVLKLFNLIEYKGARKKGKYYITQKGIDLIEKSKDAKEAHADMLADVPSPSFDQSREQVLAGSQDL